ncbi:MAG TPA: DoxX family membrane protein [Candidatus Eremiobacteraceae bacterium]|nr:DoxX family membrane protein [Candidatus Eremiobacteraceae bacterium]
MKANNALVLLRLFLGVTFAIAVYPKLAAGAQYPVMLRAFLERFALANAHPFYAAFLSGTVLPHIATFGVLIQIAETFVALALISGTATRLAAVVAMFLVTNYMFAKGLWWWYPSSNDAADFMIALALIIGSAGRTFGVDALLAERFPKVPW